MGEEVQVEWPVGGGAELAGIGPEVVQGNFRAGQRAQAARVADRGGERRHRRTRHGRLDDRLLDAQEVEEVGSRPHEGPPIVRISAESRPPDSAVLGEESFDLGRGSARGREQPGGEGEGISEIPPNH